MSQGTHKWTFVRDAVISFTPGGEVPDAEWDDFVDDLKNKRVTKWLSANIGSAEVSSVQRKKFVDLWKTKRFPIAVVTDERVVRGLVTAVAWLGVDVKAFAWSDLRAALRHLEITGSEAEETLAALTALGQQCGLRKEVRLLMGT